MKTMRINSEQGLKAVVEQSREAIREINGVQFGAIYPLLHVTNKHASYYDVESQGDRLLNAPFIVTLNS